MLWSCIERFEKKIHTVKIKLNRYSQDFFLDLTKNKASFNY